MRRCRGDVGASVPKQLFLSSGIYRLVSVVLYLSSLYGIQAALSARDLPY